MDDIWNVYMVNDIVYVNSVIMVIFIFAFFVNNMLKEIAYKGCIS